jgi:hypothetical protein
MAAAPDFDQIDVFGDVEFSSFQWDVFHCDAQVIAVCAGRRVGKTHVGAPKFFTWHHEDLDQLWVDVAEGRRPRWRGEGMARHNASRIRPDVEYWVIAPMEEHLEEIKGELLLMYTGDGERWKHPIIGGLYNKGKELWTWQDGVCGRYRFKCAARESSAVSKGTRAIWIEEAGLLDNSYYNALSPVTWDFGARMLCTGNPSLSESHWFTQLSKRGLRPEHERYDPKMGHDDAVRTFIADTIHHAYLESARDNALKELRYRGPLWAARWIFADWRQRIRNVYREWTPGVHVVPVRKRRWWEVGPHTIKVPPDEIIGLVDWSGGTAPGAAVICWLWRDNPIVPDDPRPLIVAIWDYEGHDAYADHGWWGILREAEARHGVDKWVPDPHDPTLVKAMKKAGFTVVPGPMQDKSGRIALLAGQIHFDHKDGVLPAFFCSVKCENIQRQMAGYRWQVKRSGEVSENPKQWDDHTLDGLAMLMSEVNPVIIQDGHNIYRI